MTQSPTQYDELLAAAEVASHALHQFHPQEHRIPVGRGICTWKPCQALYTAIAKARPQAHKDEQHRIEAERALRNNEIEFGLRKPDSRPQAR